MTQEEKSTVAKIIRQETGCGMYEAIMCFEKLLYALKHKPHVIMDKPYKIEIIWNNSH